MRSKRKLFRIFALCVAMNMLIATMVPTVSLALTSGPTQPEFSSFEPVATTNMVNEFTGDFTYNLPLLQVPGPSGSGYPIALSYHSGVNQEQEASWVGFGWTLNAGAINRASRGIPDDFKNKEIIQYNRTPTNWTATAGFDKWIEAFGSDKANLSLQASVRYNNYRGFGYNVGAGVKLGKGIVDLGYSISDGDGSYSLRLNPGRILNTSNEMAATQWKKLGSDKKRSFFRLQTRRLFSKQNRAANWAANMYSSLYGAYQYGEFTKSTQLKPYDGKSYQVSFGLEGDPFGMPVGLSGNIYGSYASQTTKDYDSKAFGLMYSGDAEDYDGEDADKVLMDYHIENGSSFNKRDAALGVPFNDADQFMVTGEGVGGGFKLFHSSIGHFGPQDVKNSVENFHIGGETHVGTTIGFGADAGAGQKISKLKDWNQNPSGSAFSKLSETGTVDEPVFFRFNNDLGGTWGEAINDKAFRAGLSGNDFSLQESDKFKYQPNASLRTGRSSYIGFNLNKDTYSLASQASYKAYSKRADINRQAGKREAGLEDNIGELAVFNENGIRYVYGLPVYSKEEETLSFGVEGATIENNSHAYFNQDDIGTYFSNPNTMVGNRTESAYATSFLLTEITTPGYIDRTIDGPTQDDFGGYTRFNYEKVYGNSSTNNKWFNWRLPYNGLKYQRNSLSDSRDDLGSVSRGKKEIYYLHSVETKSHVAVFSTSPREGDAFGALVSPCPKGKALVSPCQVDPGLSKDVQSSDKLMKLDSISLYSINAVKDANGEIHRNPEGTIMVPKGVTPIKTVHFEYVDPAGGGELAKGGPNNLTTRGKLTLKKVYFEYNGKSNKVGDEVRISPYVFKYKYKSFDDYPAKYRSGDEDVTLTTGNENPDYSEFNTDAWGNFQPNGADRHANMQSWLDQSLIDNENNGASGVFDPAPWHLKAIKLPSGGEIHVQYESDDYQFVQDQEAHVMASLDPATADPETTFLLDHESMGITPERTAVLGTDVNTALAQTVQMIHKRYVRGGKKIYFKFLYALLQNSEPNFDDCNSEYITGYASIESVELEGGKIKIKLESNQVPRDVCKEFTSANRLGMLDGSTNCNPASGSLNSGEPANVVRQLLGLVQGIAVPDGLCAKLSEVNSYFRVPTPLAKRGGGVRVKRLLTYDQGFEGNAVLYGNEYIYKTVDESGNVISSGVATNEPQGFREENVLIDLLERNKQKFLSKVVAGKDKKEQEGLLGEGIYPGASVGYSKIYIRNIHTGETNPGYQVNEFHTAKDHPLMMEEPTDIKDKMQFLNINAGPASYFTKKQYAAQGFSFVLNNMHGQVKRMASYAGALPDDISESNNVLVSEQVMEYFEPSEKVPVLDQAFGTIQEVSIGREVDITLAQKSFEEEMYDANVEVDVTKPLLFLLGAVITFVTAVPSISMTEGGVSTHATSKVVRYPAIVKSTTSYQDGIKHVSEPIAFDKYTGRPVSTRTYDEFVGAYLSQDIKASWEYENMGDIASSEGRLVEATFELNGNRINVAEGEECDLTAFTRGDLIELGDGSKALYHVVDIDYVQENLIVAKSQQYAALSITSASNIRIIRSGKTNALGASVGSVVMHDASGIAALPEIDESNRYKTDHEFVQDLNAAMSGLSGSGTFTLSDTYAAMDMSAYQEDISDDIAWNESNVKNVEFRYTVEAEQVRIELMAFEIACSTCAGNWHRVAAQGW